ncbi:Zinc finger, RING-type [Dillenia turbinata]|uniref:RING-type E3 ubiquitin transferase n=1 Tax=Dillenia turbinata TaxID=194707 RepID=A0AAN8Z357_9MAGN
MLLPTTSSSAQLFQHLQVNVYSRRLLLHNPIYQAPVVAAPPAPTNDLGETLSPDSSFDTNVVMALSVLLCALICSLVLNSIIRCILRYSSLVVSENSDNHSARSANTGVKKKALKTFPTINYSPGLNLPGMDAECVICLSEFTTGDKVRLLPNCNHGFHVKCIDKWLNSHSSCPTCRHCLIGTCQKIVGSGQASTSEPPPTSQETIIRIVPLEPEGTLHNYH